eukprot:1194039-Pyramimonas_sp.AAC.1
MCARVGPKPGLTALWIIMQAMWRNSLSASVVAQSTWCLVCNASCAAQHMRRKLCSANFVVHAAWCSLCGVSYG